ncbi:MAG: M14 family zinc carboxypeptidase [Candidatus Latescibacteria bacterium]|nr:M14 family zinc carboxypeptidase [Candidatus Latescibacterota bacterium]
MKLVDTDKGIEIDSDFPCSSAGDMRILEDGSYEIGFQPEELPQWFQDVLDELFDGKGVPKEYMAHVRVTNTGPETRQARLRFLLSGKGSSYMYPPWWVRRETGWEWIPLEDTSHEEGERVDVGVAVDPGSSIRVASAPYEDPEAVCEKARRLAERYDVWTYRELGPTACGRPIPLLQTPSRPIKVMVEASMQSCEPVSWGILHTAHWLTTPTMRVRRLLDQVQFCLLPMTNPDGVAQGRSVTNSEGEVPKFGINHLVEGKRAAKETVAVWDYLVELRPDVDLEVHAHFTREEFTRSVGMHDLSSMPEEMRGKAGAIEEAIFGNYHAEPLDNRKVLIDPRRPEHNVYGGRHITERAGSVPVFLQAVPDGIESHAADVREMVETVAEALVRWEDR